MSQRSPYIALVVGQKTVFRFAHWREVCDVLRRREGKCQSTSFAGIGLRSCPYASENTVFEIVVNWCKNCVEFEWRTCVRISVVW